MANWRKSSYSTGNGQCVEVMMGDELIAIRHSQRPEAGSLIFSYPEWAAFLAGVKDGEFDLPTATTP